MRTAIVGLERALERLQAVRELMIARTGKSLWNADRCRYGQGGAATVADEASLPGWTQIVKEDAGKRAEPAVATPDSAGLLEDLTRPEAYPAPRPTTIRLITTHISWVFIADHHVWKLKRPVNYGFVDYTSLGRRRYFCHEEVRVNSRLLPRSDDDVDRATHPALGIAGTAVADFRA